MKRCLWGFALLLVATSLFSSEQNKSFPLAPLAPIEKEFPLSVSPENRERYMDGPEVLAKEKIRNQEVIRRHQFPWMWLIVLAILTWVGWMAFLFKEEWLKYFYSEDRDVNDVQESEVKFQTLRCDPLLDREGYQSYYSTLSAILKDVLQQWMQPKIAALTSLEIAKSMKESALFSNEEKRKINQFFDQADAIIYAGVMPTRKDAVEALTWVESLTHRPYRVESVDSQGFQQGKNDVVAAFDFDRTFIDRDSLLVFLFYVQGWFKGFCLLLSLTPNFIGYLLSRLSRQEIKEKILTRFLKGWKDLDLKIYANAFAARVLDRYIKPGALERLQWHQSLGHRCVIVSASPDFYLSLWAARHGFEAVLSSSLEIDAENRVTGNLRGRNCWGPEKVKRLLSYLGSKDHFTLYAYGDSRGDSELLVLADFPFYRTFY